MQFCELRECNPFRPAVADVLNFLYDLFTKGKADGSGLGYSSLAVARSALSSIIDFNGLPAGQHPLVKKFLRAAFNLRPTLPKHNVIWDVDHVLTYLKTLMPLHSLTLGLLSQKLNMLLLLLTGQRGQSIFLLDIVNMTLTQSMATFRIAELAKTSRPNAHMPELRLPAYPAEAGLCVVTTLDHYLIRTAVLRGNIKRLFITTRPPYRAVARDTIRRWARTVLVAAGIDMSIFSPHSTRSAATSKAATKLPLKTILATAGWSQVSTFRRFYDRPIVELGLTAGLLP